MTDTDPVIAEIERIITIQGPRGGELEAETGVLEVCLSDAPLVEALLEAAKASYILHAYTFAAYDKGWQGDDLPRRTTRYIDDGHTAVGDRLNYALDLLSAIRAIEPEWTP